MSAPPLSPSAELRDVVSLGIRVRCRLQGAGPPLLLLHDLFASSEHWRGLSEALAGSHRTLSPDLPGFGRSERPLRGSFAYSSAAFADALRHVLAGLDAARVAVCAQGHGASIALVLAAEYPEVVDRLVLVAPTDEGAGRTWLERWATTPLVGPLAWRQFAGERTIRAMLASAHYDGTRAPLPALLEQDVARLEAPECRAAALAAVRGMADARRIVASVPRVRVPTLVVCGRNDSRTSVAAARRLSRRLPSGSLCVLDTGRSPAVEAPTELARLIANFLAKTPPKRRSRPAARTS